MKIRSRTSRMSIAVVVLGAVAFTAGCGNRLPDSEFAGSDTSVGAVDGAGTAAVPGAVTDTPVAGVPAPVAVGGTVDAPGAVAPGATDPKKSTGSGALEAAGSGAPAKNGAAVATGGSTAAATCAKPLSPIILGQSGAFTGIVGSQHSGTRDGLAVWVQAVNARGGVQCHPIKVIAQDDGSDPGRATANLTDLVKSKGAVAIVAPVAVLTSTAYRSAAERLQVPIIGGDLSAPDYWRSPYMFPHGGEAIASYNIGQRYAAKVTQGATKVGLVYCVEASICTEQKNNFPTATQKMGLEVGPVQAVSLTQPDYTAECQAMKTADVKAVWIMVDGAAIGRFLRSCSALGYYPTGITGSAAIGNPASGDNPNMRKNGIFMGAQAAPFVATDSPGLKEFHAAMDRIAPGLTLGQATMNGWASGKLLEAALAKVADKARAGNVTTAMILDGLWTVKDETLDGLSPGVSFVKGKPAPAIPCSFVLAIGKDGWTAPQGSKRECI